MRKILGNLFRKWSNWLLHIKTIELDLTSAPPIGCDQTFTVKIIPSPEPVKKGDMLYYDENGCATTEKTDEVMGVALGGGVAVPPGLLRPPK